MLFGNVMINESTLSAGVSSELQFLHSDPPATAPQPAPLPASEGLTSLAQLISAEAYASALGFAVEPILKDIKSLPAQVPIDVPTAHVLLAATLADIGAVQGAILDTLLKAPGS
jgi:hypothetical protein